MQKVKYTVTLTGWDNRKLTFYDWEDVQCFLAYVVEGCKGEYVGFLIKEEVTE